MKSKDENNDNKIDRKQKLWGLNSFFFCDLWVKKAKTNQRSKFFKSKIQKIDIWR